MPGLISLILFYLLIKKVFRPEKYIDNWGYVVITNLNELEHRHIAKQRLKRNLSYDEVVHHINGKKIDNRVENLCLMNREKHEHFHAWLTWKKKKSGHYPSIEDQKRTLENEYAGTLLENIRPPSLEPISIKVNPMIEKKEEPNESYRKERQRKLFDQLRKERKRIAEQKNLPVYLIFNNRTLFEMSERRPSTEDMMLQISGVGPAKMAMYGWNFLTVIKIFQEIEIDQKKKSEAI